MVYLPTFTFKKSTLHVDKIYKSHMAPDHRYGQKISVPRVPQHSNLCCLMIQLLRGTRNLKLTTSSHLEMDGWNRIVSFWVNLGLFSGAFAISFGEGKVSQFF